MPLEANAMPPESTNDAPPLTGMAKIAWDFFLIGIFCLWVLLGIAGSWAIAAVYLKVDHVRLNAGGGPHGGADFTGMAALFCGAIGLVPGILLGIANIIVCARLLSIGRFHSQRKAVFLSAIFLGWLGIGLIGGAVAAPYQIPPLPPGEHFVLHAPVEIYRAAGGFLGLVLALLLASIAAFWRTK